MDRLTALIERFRLEVRAASTEEANLLITATNGVPDHVTYWPSGRVDLSACDQKEAYFIGYVCWVALHNPLVAALPPQVDIDLRAEPEIQALIALMRQEAEAKKCGAQTVVRRLGEVLMVRLLRLLVAEGTTHVGLLAGLSDVRLARAIVAIHDHPSRLWTTSDLAQEAGLSVSRFSELFGQNIGETPIGYLRRWRLTLARQDLLRGDRVEAVARRYAYESPEGFSRAFRKAYDEAPVSLRRSLQEA